MKRQGIGISVVLGGAFIVGCSSFPMFGMFGLHGMSGEFPTATALLPEDATNGEWIFKTGLTADGKRVTAEGGPFWFSMHGGGCAACHGIDGRGGQRVMMTDQIAPNIRYSRLTSAEEDHENGEDHPPYDDVLIGRAIRDGLNPADESLNHAMPRWALSDEEMADLIDYLKTLGETSDEG